MLTVWTAHAFCILLWFKHEKYGRLEGLTEGLPDVTVLSPQLKVSRS